MTTTDSENEVVAERVIDEAMLDRLMAQVDREGLELLGPDGVLTELTSLIMNRAMEAEMTEHLGYEQGDPAGHGSGNNRNGTSPKTVLTDAGAIPVKVPRDRNGEFEPLLVPKHARRLAGFNDIVLSLVSNGMTTRDIQSHLAAAYKVDVSPELISKITDAVLPELRAWQSRPLEVMYPILYLDAIVVKVRTDGRVTNRPVYIAMAVDLDGEKHVLGLWLGAGDEGSKYWLGVLTELRNRGVADILIVILREEVALASACFIWVDLETRGNLLPRRSSLDNPADPHGKVGLDLGCGLRHRRQQVQEVGEGPVDEVAALFCCRLRRDLDRDDLVTQADALVEDVDARASHKLLYFGVVLPPRVLGGIRPRCEDRAGSTPKSRTRGGSCGMSTATADRSPCWAVEQLQQRRLSDEASGQRELLPLSHG